MIIITFNNLMSRTTKPIQSNSTQITNPCSKHHISQIIKNTSQNHENITINMKYKERIEKPIPFSRRLKMKKWATMEVFVRNMGWVWERFYRGRQWKDTKCSRENPNILISWPNCIKHVIFTTDLSREQVTRVSHKTLWNQNFWKFF